MKFYLTSAYPITARNFGPAWLRKAAELDRSASHQITDDPDTADVVLFVENHPGHDPYFFEVLRDPIYRRHKHKCLLFHDADYVVPIVPGVFASIDRSHYDPDRTRSFQYIARLHVNDHLRYLPPPGTVPYLFSFVGATRGKPPRSDVLSLRHPRSLLIGSQQVPPESMEPQAKAAYFERFARSVEDSAFVLCPRGVGSNTFRIYEAMEVGRAPVIISDEWVPPRGPVWEDFSIRVPEDRVRDIPAILEAAEPRWKEMGLRARSEWERWFAPEVTFRRLADECADLQRGRHLHGSWRTARAWLRFLEPFHARNLMRYLRNRHLRDWGDGESGTAPLEVSDPLELAPSSVRRGRDER